MMEGECSISNWIFGLRESSDCPNRFGNDCFGNDWDNRFTLKDAYPLTLPVPVSYLNLLPTEHCDDATLASIAQYDCMRAGNGER